MPPPHTHTRTHTHAHTYIHIHTQTTHTHRQTDRQTDREKVQRLTLTFFTIYYPLREEILFIFNIRLVQCDILIRSASNLIRFFRQFAISPDFIQKNATIFFEIPLLSFSFPKYIEFGLRAIVFLYLQGLNDMKHAPAKKWLVVDRFRMWVRPRFGVAPKKDR